LPGIDPAKVVHQNEARDGSEVNGNEERHHDGEDKQDALPGEVKPGEGKTRHGIDQPADEHRGDPQNKGIDERSLEITRKQIPVCLQGEIDRQKGAPGKWIGVAEHQVVRREGGCDRP